MNQEQYDKLMAVIAQASNAADDMRRKWEAHGMNSMSELAAVRQRQCNEAFDIVMTLYAESNLTSPEAFATNPHRVPEAVADTPGAITHFIDDKDGVLCGALPPLSAYSYAVGHVTCQGCLAVIHAREEPGGKVVDAEYAEVIDSGEGYSLGKDAAESLAGILDEETMQQQTPLNGWLFVMNADKEEWGPKLPPSIISRINECCQKGFGNVTEADVPRAFAAGFKRAMIQGQAVS